MPAPTGGVLRVEGLVVEVQGRGVQVLRGVSFVLGRGEVLGIVGESGSGKSTLARCLLRLEAPLAVTGGRILFAGFDMMDRLTKPALRRLRGGRIALVPQDPLGAFDPLFTVGAQVHEFVATHVRAIAEAAGTRPAEALAVTHERMAAFGIAQPAAAGARHPHTWSRGMLQRALFALATAPAPDVLVLDEPTAALDAPVADRLVAEIGRLAKTRGTATILITHDLALAAICCDRLLVLKHGAVVESGRTRDLLAGARDAYTRALIASAAW